MTPEHDHLARRRRIRSNSWLTTLVTLAFFMFAAITASSQETARTAGAAAATSHTRTLLVLHTNDIHDIIKPPTTGNQLGGLAYVAGYVHKVRAERKDVLVLDAGDELQKGDQMSVVTKGEVMYRALGAVGYDASVPGNHDFFYGMDQLMKNITTGGFPVLCSNLLYADDGKPILPETLEKEVNGVRVGIIGATIGRTPRGTFQGRAVKMLDRPDLEERIHRLAVEMKPRVDLIICIYHQGTYAAKVAARYAPEVNLFIQGHTNEVTEQPMVTTESGALIVTVGRAAQWVGHLDMVVDTDAKKIAKYDYKLVPMDHKTIQPDEELAKQITAWDKQYTPKGEKGGATGSKGSGGQKGAKGGKGVKSGNGKMGKGAAAKEAPTDQEPD